MKLNRLLILSLGVFMLMACKREGCTDQTADNYDKKAKNDDGSCIYDGVLPNNPNNPNNPNDPNQTLPIHLTGTETSNITIQDQSTNPNVADYYIDGTWSLNAAVTIEPGVKIEMRSGARIIVKSNGSLNATGTPSNKINILGAQDVPGYWYCIEFESNNPNNKLIHCNIANGSKYYSSQPAMIVVENNSQVTIQNSNIRKSSEFGIMTDGVDAKLPNFQSNTINDCSRSPILLSGLSHTKYLDNTTQFSNNTIQRVYINGNNVSANLTVPNLNIPYSMRENISFTSGATNIQAGTEIYMAADVRWGVGSNASLAFDGTSSNTVKVAGEQPSKGYWYNINYESNDMNNIISYTNISGGRNYYSSSPGMVRLTGSGTVYMNNSSLSNSLTSAIEGNTPANFSDNGGNSHYDCDGGGGLLP